MSAEQTDTKTHSLTRRKESRAPLLMLSTTIIIVLPAAQTHTHKEDGTVCLFDAEEGERTRWKLCYECYARENIESGKHWTQIECIEP